MMVPRDDSITPVCVDGRFDEIHLVNSMIQFRHYYHVTPLVPTNDTDRCCFGLTLRSLCTVSFSSRGLLDW